MGRLKTIRKEQGKDIVLEEQLDNLVRYTKRNESLIEEYKNGETTKIGSTFTLKIHKREFKLQRIEFGELEDYEPYGVFIVFEVRHWTETLRSFRTGSDSLVKKQSDTILRDIVLPLEGGNEEKKKVLEKELAFCQCNSCKTWEYGNNVRFDQDKFWCKKCYEINIF